MTFPTLRTADTQTGTQTSNSNNWALVWPTNLVAGDLVLAVVSWDGGGSSTWPSGWVDTIDIDGAGAVGLVVAKYEADGTETGTFNVGFSATEQGCWSVFRISGWEGTLGTTMGSTQSATDGAVHRGSSANGTSTSPNPLSLDPLNWGTEDTLWMAAAGSDHGNTTYTGFPTDYTNTSAQESGGSNGTGLGIAWRAVNASSQDPGAFTTDASEQWAAVTVAIRPAAAPPPSAGRSFAIII